MRRHRRHGHGLYISTHTHPAKKYELLPRDGQHEGSVTIRRRGKELVCVHRIVGRSSKNAKARLAMSCTRLHVVHMPKMIQIRHVPDGLHRRLRARAAMAGMTLSDFLRQELERSAERLTVAELRERLASLQPATVSEAPAAAVRRERDGR